VKTPVDLSVHSIYGEGPSTREVVIACWTSPAALSVYAAVALLCAIGWAIDRRARRRARRR
jgi:hypothetical protein